jgi:hypothetical protein
VRGFREDGICGDEHNKGCSGCNKKHTPAVGGEDRPGKAGFSDAAESPEEFDDNTPFATTFAGKKLKEKAKSNGHTTQTEANKGTGEEKRPVHWRNGGSQPKGEGGESSGKEGVLAAVIVSDCTPERRANHHAEENGAGQGGLLAR